MNEQRAELINNLGELVENLENDIEKLEEYRQRLKDGDDPEEVSQDFLEDKGFFLD